MNRSIDILEELARESGNMFHLSRRGYVYATADPNKIRHFKRVAEESASMGAGPVRYHTGEQGDPLYIPSSGPGFEDHPAGIDLIVDQTTIRKYFPYLSENVAAVVHARRCGWLSVQQLGMCLLERAKERGTQLFKARVVGVEIRGNQVERIRMSGGSLDTIATRNFVNAAGPMVKEVGRMVGVELPVFCELHLKMSFGDHRCAVPRNAPLLIWSDPVRLPWTKEERNLLTESEEMGKLLEELPPGVHTRPEGGAQSNILLGLWAYHTPPVESTFPFTIDPRYPEMVLRGLATMIPSFKAYVDRLPKSVVDGGYYTKTRENRPLIGKLPVEGAYIIGALSGFGVMASCGAGELLAAHLTGSKLPHYASAFSLERYKDPEYQKLLEAWPDSGQL